MNYRYEVQVIGDQNWYSNAVVFPTKEEADNAGAAKHSAWTLCAGWRVVETEEPANYNWVRGVGLQAIVTPTPEGPATDVVTASFDDVAAVLDATEKMGKAIAHSILNKTAR